VPTPLKKRISRYNRLEVNTGTDEAPNWVLVRGLNKIALKIDANEVDVSDFDSEGWDDSMTTHRAWSLEVTGFDGYTGPDSSQVDDPGQAFLKTKGVLTGPEAYVSIRTYRADNNKGRQGRVVANWNGTDEDVKGVTPFTCPLTGSGPLTEYTNVP
jgi:hypothetical protein